MKDKKLIVLIVLGIGAVISLVYGISTPAKSKYKSSLSSPAVVQAANVQPSGDIVSAQRSTRKTSFDSWGRNPFVKGSSGTSSGLALNAVMWHGAKPQAMINGEMVTVGSKIGPNTVVEIKKESIILSDGASNFELKVKYSD